MKSFQTQRIMWATDWPVIRTTTRSPTPPPSTLPSLFCPSTPTPHSQPQPPVAAAPPPPPQNTPTLLPHTPQPSLNTPRYRVCPPHLREWRRTPFPKSSTSELGGNKQTQSHWAQTFAPRVMWQLLWTSTRTMQQLFVECSKTKSAWKVQLERIWPDWKDFAFFMIQLHFIGEYCQLNRITLWCLLVS